MVEVNFSKETINAWEKISEYRANGINYSKLRFLFIIKTQMAFKSEQFINVKSCAITITPYTQSMNSFEGYNSQCEVVFEGFSEDEDKLEKFARSELNIIFTLLNLPFEISHESKKLYFYAKQNEWIENFNPNIKASFLQVHENFSNEFLTLIDNLNIIQKNASVRKKQIFDLIEIYRNGLKYQENYHRDSFLYFYLILERLANDLPSNKSLI